MTANTTADTPQVSVWRNAGFLSLWSSAAVSSLADNAYFILLGWFVLQNSGSALKLGITWTAAAIPRLILMLFGGVLADRMSRRLIIILSVAARALVLAAFAGWILAHAPALWSLCAVAVLFGAVDAFFWPASSSIIPQIVTARQLPAANSLLQGTQVASMVGGPLLASALLLLGSFPALFAALAGLYAVSSLLLTTLRLANTADGDGERAPATPPPPFPDGMGRQVWRKMAEGVRYAWSIPVIAVMMAASLFINLLFMGPINIGLPVWVHSMGWAGSTYAHLEAAFGIGAIGGALLAGATRAMRGRLRYVGLVGALMGVAMALLGSVASWVPGLFLMALMGSVVSFINIPIMTFVQTICDADKLGRVQSLFSLMSIGFVPVSYTLSSFVLQFHLLSVHALLITCGVLNAAIMTAITFLPTIWRVEEHPRWQASALPGKGCKQSIGDDEGIG